MVLAHNIDEIKRTKDVQISQDITFESMLLSNNTLDGLRGSGFYKPSPIQLHAVPLGKCGFDLILEAKSGTGKTAVFTIIALEKIDLNKDLQVIILAPTREIAAQICDVFKQIGCKYDGLCVEVVMGGLPIQDDIKKFKENKVHILVASPGRLKHLIIEKHINTHSVRLFVLDEADKLMDKSFLTDVTFIHSILPTQKQVILSSATYPPYCKEVIDQFVYGAQHICPNTDCVLLGIAQKVTFVKCHNNALKLLNNKFQELLKIIKKINFKQCLIFCNYQTRVEDLYKMLIREKWPAEQLYGKQEQTERLGAIKTLQEYKCRLLITTDLAARGIDASNVDLVINFEQPFEWQTYLHRIGRAGRYGSFGTAVTILSEGLEKKKFLNMLQSLKVSISITSLWSDDIVTENTDDKVSEDIDTTEKNICDIVNEDTDDIETEDSNDMVTENTDEIETENTDEIVTENTDAIVTENTDEIVTEDSDDIVTENTGKKQYIKSNDLTTKTIQNTINDKTKIEPLVKILIEPQCKYNKLETFEDLFLSFNKYEMRENYAKSYPYTALHSDNHNLDESSYYKYKCVKVPDDTLKDCFATIKKIKEIILNGSETNSHIKIQENLNQSNNISCEQSVSVHHKSLSTESQNFIIDNNKHQSQSSKNKIKKPVIENRSLDIDANTNAEIIKLGLPLAFSSSKNKSRIIKNKGAISTVLKNSNEKMYKNLDENKELRTEDKSGSEFIKTNSAHKTQHGKSKELRTEDKSGSEFIKTNSAHKTQHDKIKELRTADKSGSEFIKTNSVHKTQHGKSKALKTEDKSGSELIKTNSAHKTQHGTKTEITSSNVNKSKVSCSGSKTCQTNIEQNYSTDNYMNWYKQLKLKAKQVEYAVYIDELKK